MEIETISVRLISRPGKEPATEVRVKTTDGCFFLTMQPWAETLSEGFQRAKFQQRQGAGFYTEN